ncbi:MAG: CIA30 family protein [Proteobacteria bacterium]|nr:CIA30 family protein [Pseudomonadota bacterium]
MLVDDFSNTDLISTRGTHWRAVSDQVMGGISDASISHAVVDGRPCLRLSGDVRLETNGGFVQAALDLQPRGDSLGDPLGDILDASGYTGLRLIVRGNGELYSLHLRTPDNVRPWQSYRAHFTAGADWQTIDIPFEAFKPHRLETPLDVARLQRIGLVAIGRAFHADVAVCAMQFYR